MNLHCESFGSGPDVVLIHGWGWHGDVWRPLARRLATRFRVWIPDLPGHGRSRRSAVAATLDAWTRAVQACVPMSALWIGWSLGGLIALTAARARHAARLMLIGATPRFVQDTDWDCAWSADRFMHFSDDVDHDAGGALERFTSLHLATGTAQRQLLRGLRAERVRHGVPETQALRAGLDILRDADMRAQLPQITVPALALHGDRDQIVFPEAAERMARALPNSRHTRIADAGHALPLSHVEHIVTAIGDFVSA